MLKKYQQKFFVVQVPICVRSSDCLPGTNPKRNIDKISCAAFVRNGGSVNDFSLHPQKMQFSSNMFFLNVKMYGIQSKLLNFAVYRQNICNVLSSVNPTKLHTAGYFFFKWAPQGTITLIFDGVDPY
jgi:hypothetical protein